MYLPELEDWLFHVMLPLAAYAIIALFPVIDASNFSEAMFGVGAAALLLLLVGIQNAWDNIAYFVFFHINEPDKKQ